MEVPDQLLTAAASSATGKGGFLPHQVIQVDQRAWTEVRNSPAVEKEGRGKSAWIKPETRCIIVNFRTHYTWGDNWFKRLPPQISIPMPLRGFSIPAVMTMQLFVESNSDLPPKSVWFKAFPQGWGVSTQSCDYTPPVGTLPSHRERSVPPRVEQQKSYPTEILPDLGQIRASGWGWGNKNTWELFKPALPARKKHCQALLEMHLCSSSPATASAVFVNTNTFSGQDLFSSRISSRFKYFYYTRFGRRGVKLWLNSSFHLKAAWCEF